MKEDQSFLIWIMLNSCNSSGCGNVDKDKNKNFIAIFGIDLPLFTRYGHSWSIFISHMLLMDSDFLSPFGKEHQKMENSVVFRAFSPQQKQ